MSFKDNKRRKKLKLKLILWVLSAYLLQTKVA